MPAASAEPSGNAPVQKPSAKSWCEFPGFYSADENNCALSRGFAIVRNN
jgi:hypothetical protein